MGKTHIIIVSIIIGTGLLGGVTNFFMTFDIKLKGKECWMKLLASISLSLCAALTVPLFLQILSNNILDVLSFKNALIFSGFCVLASFFSKRFLEDVYSKLNKLDKKVDDKNEETNKNLETFTKKTETTIKKVDDLEESLEQLDDEIPVEIKTSILENIKVSIEKSEVEKIIKELFSTKYAFRTIEGIKKETKINADEILNVLEALQEFGFAEKKIGSSGKEFWRSLKYPIRIYSASYGVSGKFIDVTSKIKALVSKEGTYQGVASHLFFGIPDPAYGTPKTLKIHCRIRGKEQELSFNENDSFKIE